VPDLASRLADVRAQIADAAADADRDPADITTIVVTKFHPALLVRELAALGVRDFGESRHQEAQPKVASLADLDATWHFIGQVQSKKARQVRAYVDVIHSVDRPALVDALASPVAGAPVDVFLQVNLTDDPERGGAQPESLANLADRVAGSEGLRLRGLMAVAPLDESPVRAFARVRELSEILQSAHPAAVDLSMGMSGDFREAIREGATHLRIGTAITGNRPTPG
jgi:pyridoxal phosphate enzyme (YggS family)